MLTENQLFANRYRSIKLLGQGAFSEVWKAEDTKVSNLTVALKVYAPDKGLDKDGAEVFGDEFAIVFNLHHQNLLTPSTFDEENGSPYLVLPFCERGSSLRLVEKMDEQQVAKFLRDVSSALTYLHERGIVHQDIKPDNVLIDEAGDYLVTDFGISTRIRSTLWRSVGDKKSAGTRAYMGPERYGRNKQSVMASDVWSLGATVFELMRGDVPFGEDGGLVQMMGALVPETGGQYSVELKRLVEKCLSKETWDRPTARQLRDICDGFLRTGTWNMTSLNKVGVQEPEKPKKTTGWPTENKVMISESGQSARMPLLIEPLLKPKPEKQRPAADKELNLVHRRHLLWIIGGGVAAVTLLAVVLGVVLGHKPKVEDNVPHDPAVEALAQTYTINSVSFTMKYVEGGTFRMGATSEQGRDAKRDENPVHSVMVSDFCMGETEVTQALWKVVMGSNPSHHEGDSLPVESVSWDDCQEFIRKLNQLTGKTFRLPTEAEWEYAARGGNKSCRYKYAGGSTIDNVVWYDENSGNTTHPVNGRQANELGLYDMSGNVYEWC